MTSQRIAVIGAGSWGTAMAGILAEKGLDVVLVGHDEAEMRRMAKTRKNKRFLPRYRIPDSVEMTVDGEAAVSTCDVALSVVPTRRVRETWKALGGSLRHRTPVVSLSKGIENRTLKRPSEIIREFAPGHPVAVLTGPSHAEEVVNGQPTTVTVGARNKDLARELRKLFTTATFRVYSSTDIIGLELGGAVKNVIALAAGMLDGLGCGDNTKSALLTRGLAEIVGLGCALGARRKTFYGMAGVGDLITTAISPFGRNRAVGERIGKGEKLEDILASMDMVCEGAGTTKSVVALAKKVGVEMPITREVHRVLFKGKDPRRAVEDLMLRATRDE